jgi:hypothetical protein
LAASGGGDAFENSAIGASSAHANLRDQVCNEEENPMSKRLAEIFGLYECNVIGTIGKDPIAGESGHLLVSLEYSCVGLEGLMKGDVHTASSASEWIGPKGTFLRGGGVHRAPDGLAVSVITDGTGWVVKSSDTEYAGPAGTASAGTGIFKFASGSLAALSGKTFKFATKPMAPNRFVMEFTDLAPN